MPSLWFYGWMSRFKLLSCRVKIMVLAFIGTHIPLITLTSYFAIKTSTDWMTALMTIGVTLVATLAGTLATLFCLHHLLRPIVATATALRSYRTNREIVPLPEHYTDDVGKLMSDAHATVKHLDEMIVRLAHLDEATGLPNRRKCSAELERQIERGSAFVVVVLRFPDYRRIASAFDTVTANQVMETLADRLLTQLRQRDNLARISEGEFAFITGKSRTNLPNWVELSARLKTLIDAVSDEFDVAGSHVKPQIRGGAATYPDNETRPEKLIEYAITAASQSNESVPVTHHSSELRDRARTHFKMEQELRNALRNNELMLHYQPVVDTAAGKVVSSEALIRWQHPEQGLVSPGEFIPVAEASGLIDPIGVWVMQEACRQIREWNQSGLADHRVAINLSARQFRDKNLARQIGEAITGAGIEPGQLEIELTESVAMADEEHTRDVFRKLRDHGVRMSIDDFGTGYASMSYLRKLPFDKLKIDREFIQKVHSTRDRQAICQAMVTLGKGLGLEVLAEGVEDIAEVSYLNAIGCSHFQGFYFARPTPAHDLLDAVDNLNESFNSNVILAPTAQYSI